jgi:hypothetical protein
MQAAERIVAGPALEAALWDELAALQQMHPGGFLVRLHVLGDFYSVDYAQLWHEALEAYPALHIFGYTAREPSSRNRTVDLRDDRRLADALPHAVQRMERASQWGGDRGQRRRGSTSRLPGSDR